MKLIDDWKDVLKRAHSVKFMVLAAILSGVEVLFQLAEPTLSESMPKGLFPALAGLVTAAGVVARVLAQNEAQPKESTE
jgi:hypothetical protein